MAELSDYFTSRLITSALQRYDEMLGENWPLDHKVEMYEAAEVAFGGAGTPDHRLKAFQKVYGNLRGYWQVFRNAASTLSCEDLFARLNVEATDFSRQSGCCLVDSLKGEFERNLFVMLGALREVKVLPSGGYSEMAVSKFLHFYNPTLFPIYDTAFVGNRVFKAFRDEYRQFCDSNGFEVQAGGARFYVQYLMWGNQIIREAGDQFMDNFSSWYVDSIHNPQKRDYAAARVSRYYGAAFEMIAIGGAQMELDRT